ncbi:MAG: undecaprenyl/decaprenyl-phosphate alpha-N-acetylglucosaminyl 1-phosphate transferase [Candidatus Magasanikbacteria bacterium]|nr:undecaprenyl/decaprenyl-phosphate alpha-N-acetylglucosaminyl 1-phosphate transferase [Candidatus Magasanikbacteria bacterium]
MSLSLSKVVLVLMKKMNVMDIPHGKRKRHKKKIPLGGGLAIMISFFIVSFSLYYNGILGLNVGFRKFIGLFVGSLILIIGGFLDDKYNLKAKTQIVFPIFAVLVVIFFGVGPHIITNPFGGVFDLSLFKVSFGSFGDWAILADIIVFFWLMAMMYTTKLLDGLDGLVTGLVFIGALMIFSFSTYTIWFQPEIAVISIVFAGACLGFLVWNFSPAKIFLGEGGSLFVGFILGSLAIISGSKIAITLLVVGVPMLDIGRVIIRRIQKKKSVFLGDREHLHFQLLESGFSQKQAVLFFYTIAILFGLTALFLQSSQKLIALVLLFILMLLLAFRFTKINKKQEAGKK